MSELRSNGSGGRTTEVEHLMDGIKDLDENLRKVLLAGLMGDVFYGPAKRVAVAEAMKSASDPVAQELVAEAIEHADGPGAKRAAAVRAVQTADEGAEPDVLAGAVGSASTLKARKAAAVTAVETAVDARSEQEVIAAAVGHASDSEARKSAVAAAVETADRDKRVEIAAEAVEHLPARAQAQIASRFLPSEKAADKIWLKIVNTFSTILVLGMLGLVAVVGLAVFREVDKDLVQIMLTVFSTIAGILAGFITGQAFGTSSNQ